MVQAAGPSFGDGFVLSTSGRKLIVVGDTEVFGVAKQRRTAARNRANWNAFLSEISPGDYVVHVEHGVGKFLGVGRPSEQAESSGEYLILEYANGDRLYVPLEHLDRVTPYIAPSDAPPHLTRLGTQEWSRAKARAERSTRRMAAELLALVRRTGDGPRIPLRLGPRLAARAGGVVPVRGDARPGVHS